jgi:hypothetical protein
MNDTQILEQLAKTDAYAPGTSMPASAWDRSTALSAIQRRIDMQTTERPTSTPPFQRRRPGWLVAAAGFAIVLIVGLGLALLAPSGDDAPPATAPPTELPVTTAAVPLEQAMNVALADIAAALSGAGTLPSAAEGVMFDDDPLPEYVEFAAALDTTVTFADCQFNDAVATCRGTRTNRILDAMGYTETATWTVNFNEAWVSGDRGATPVVLSLIRITDAESRLVYEGIGSSTVFEEDYIHWVTAVHPEWRAERGLGEFEDVRFDGATGAIYSRYVDEYAVAIAENGPPNLSYRNRW